MCLRTQNSEFQKQCSLTKLAPELCSLRYALQHPRPQASSEAADQCFTHSPFCIFTVVLLLLTCWLPYRSVWSVNAGTTFAQPSLDSQASDTLKIWASLVRCCKCSWDHLSSFRSGLQLQVPIGEGSRLPRARTKHSNTPRLNRDHD